jgi:phosphoketolase
MASTLPQEAQRQPAGDSQEPGACGTAPVPAQQLRAMGAYWRAADTLSVGQLDVLDNPLRKEPLQREHIKPRPLGHCGTTPGLKFISVQLDRVIKDHDLDNENLHVRRYAEKGTTTTPFDMAVLNQIDRFSLVGDVIDRVPKLGERAAYVQQAIREKLIDDKNDIGRHGDGMPEVRDWKGPGRASAERAADNI